jgi:hypothetical protein
MPEYLETTVDKFTFKVARDRFYTRDGFGSSGQSVALAADPQAANSSAGACRAYERACLWPYLSPE